MQIHVGSQNESHAFNIDTHWFIIHFIVYNFTFVNINAKYTIHSSKDCVYKYKIHNSSYEQPIAQTFAFQKLLMTYASTMAIQRNAKASKAITEVPDSSLCELGESNPFESPFSLGT